MPHVHRDLDELPPGKGSVFWRIRGVERTASHGAIITLIEIDRYGFIPREVSIAEDGTPTAIIRPGERGGWNDSKYVPQIPPESAAFEEYWSDFGVEIDRHEFELMYQRADASLPQRERGGGWSGLVPLGCLAVALVVGAITGVIGLFVQLVGRLFS